VDQDGILVFHQKYAFADRSIVDLEINLAVPASELPAPAPMRAAAAAPGAP
jgi:hypothetical protein